MASENATSDLHPDDNALVRLSVCHTEIRRHCSRLEQFVRDRHASNARARRAPSIQHIIDFIDVDVRRHHIIEDIALFPPLLALPLPRADMAALTALVAALREDHRLLELMWTAIKPALVVAAQGGVLATGLDISTFVTSYRHHMKREDTGIFPFAHRHLDQPALQAIAAAMDAGSAGS